MITVRSVFIELIAVFFKIIAVGFECQGTILHSLHNMSVYAMADERSSNKDVKRKVLENLEPGAYAQVTYSS